MNNFTVPRNGVRCSQKNLAGVCGSLPKPLTSLMAKICDFPYPIYAQTKNLDNLITTASADIVSLNIIFDSLSFYSFINDDEKVASCKQHLPNSRQENKTQMLLNTKVAKYNTLFMTKMAENHTFSGRIPV